MTIGILRLVLFVQNSNSLKSKRRVLHSLKARLRNRFNVSISQIADEDKWQKISLAIVAVGKNKRYIDQELCRIINFIENFNQASIVDCQMEVL